MSLVKVKNKIRIYHYIVAISILCILSSGSSTEQQNFEAYDQRLEGTEVVIPMVPIPGGEFVMGDSNETGKNTNEGPQRKVKVDSFWMSAYEIDWEKYEHFLNRELDKIAAKNKGKDVDLDVDGVSSATIPYIDMSEGMGKKGYPVVNITQYAAATFCKWLSAKTGYFYRLPTEAEWEYACRAGSTDAFYFGDDPEKLGEYAWYDENSDGKYHQVGQKKPNAWGLYDMHGNVSEWTLDQYDPDFYKTGEVNNPWNVPDELYPRVVRGGAWDDDKDALRCSARQHSTAAWKQLDPQIPKSLWWHTNAPFVGFRIVRPKVAPPKEEQEKYWLKVVQEF